MAKENKRFSDWEEVDCNDCTHYWDSSCDGATRGSRVGCNSYLATRSIVIPHQIKRLENRVAWIEFVIAFECIVVGLLFIARSVNG